MTFKVQQRMCATCIYRPDSPLDIARLEAQIADPRMAGHFKGYRECHHAERGSGGQLAQRLGLVCFVDAD